ncbi:Putative NAD(P)H nitroreductase YfkO [Paenibacillus plantiphilus]|uniref:NAD(P)H nitroreductase YfkO n=1 Tax=Paenibacillus plantiphilus TaxID=2905650 RepID=A0ABN8FZD1_9BACL|nr:NAD(P)H-dependent oxidoreductase [Paenibacillus plantiphilus]CAH1195208.1 Putative NAD(P)H nitroreductase YfkO [Paenibacillus plantiphilus]
MSDLQAKKNELLSAFQFRHATKEFDPNKKISEADFQYILETGRLSPSSFGFEPWKFVIVQNQDIRAKLAEYASGARRQLPTASHFMIILSRLPKDMVASSDYIRRMMVNVQQLSPEIAEGKRTTYDHFLKTGFAIEDDPRVMFEWACRQTYIALGNMMTAAAWIGIDSCPIEGFNREKISDLLVEEGIMDPEHYGVAVMAAFGYRLHDPADKTRRCMQEVVEWVE